MSEHGISTQPFVRRHADLDTEAIDLRLLPLNRKCDRRVEDGVEVIIPIRVLPEVFAVDDQEFTYALFETSIELIARSRLNPDIAGSSENARGCAGDDKVLVVRCRHQTRVPDAQNGVGRFHQVADAESRL